MLSSHFKTGNMHYAIQDGPNAGQTVHQVHMHILPGANSQIGQAENSGVGRTIEEMRLEAL